MSAGRVASRKLTSDITDEPASERLLKASACSAIEALSTPAMNLPAKSTRFISMPIRLAILPPRSRVFGSPGVSQPLIILLQKAVNMLSPSHVHD